MELGLNKKSHSTSVKVEIKKEEPDTTSKKRRSRTVKREQLDDESSEESFIDSDEYSDQYVHKKSIICTTISDFFGYNRRIYVKLSSFFSIQQYLL